MVRLRRSLDLVLVLAAAWLAVGLTLSESGSGWLRVGLGLPLVLVWPGYALTMLACPHRARGLAQTAAYWVGLSLIVTALGGLALHFTPEGLTARSWALFLGGVTTLCCVGAGWRRRGEPICLPTLRQTLGATVWFALAGGVVIGAVAWARLGALRQPQPGFTQFWMTSVEEASAPTWQLSIRNVERDTQPYRVVVTLDGEELLATTVRGLEPGLSVALLVSLPPDHVAAGGRIEALLYRGDDPPEPHRRLIWWVE